VVELDIMVLELAQTYFGFVPGPNVEVRVEDGRGFIENAAPQSYDQIWLDAFSGAYVPPSLSGRAFLDLCKSRLAPGGLLLQNLHQNHPELFQDQLKTTQAVFGDFIGLDGTFCGNAIIIAAKPGSAPTPPWNPETLKKAAKKFGPRLGPYDLVAEMKKFKKFVPNTEAAIIP
jgi:spermidine synthase